MDDVTLNAIFRHFANPYVSMPMVGTCRRVFITWTKKRRELALDEMRRLKRWLRAKEMGAPPSTPTVDGLGFALSVFPYVKSRTSSDEISTLVTYGDAVPGETGMPIGEAG